MMLEDQTKRLVVEQAQKIIDELCKKENVPAIPVIFVESLENPLASAVFDGDKYCIEITDKIDAHALTHELNHYFVKLCVSIYNLEERLTERASLGMEYELYKNKKWEDEFNKFNCLMNEHNGTNR